MNFQCKYIDNSMNVNTDHVHPTDNEMCTKVWWSAYKSILGSVGTIVIRVHQDLSRPLCRGNLHHKVYGVCNHLHVHLKHYQKHI